MIAQAFDTPVGRCTCYDVNTAGGALSCPQHGACFPHSTQPKTLPPPLTKPATHHARSEYTRGRVRGFKEGFDAAVAMLGEP